MGHGRLIVRLSLALALAVAVHLFVVFDNGGRRTILRRDALFASDGSVDSIRVRRRGEPATVIANTGNWSLVEPFLGQVDERAVLRLLDGVRFSPIVDRLAEAELLRLGRSRADFGLDDPGVEVVLRSELETTVIDFGQLTPAADGVYASVHGEDSVFVVPSNVLEAVNLSADGFRRRSILSVEPERVVAMDLRQGIGRLMRFARNGESWTMTQPVEAVAVESRIRAVLAGLSNASAISFVWPVGTTNEQSSASAALLAGYGLGTESAVTLTVRCVDGVDRQVSFGDETEGDLVYALVHNGIAVVTVPSSLKALVEGDVTSFTDMRLFPCEPAQVTLVTIEDGDVRCLLAADRDGTWRLDSPIVAQADMKVAETIVSRLLSLGTADLEAGGLSVAIGTNAAPVRVSRAAVLGDLRLEDLRSRDVLRVDSTSVKRLSSLRAKAIRPTSVLYDRDRKVWNVETAEGGGGVDPASVERILSVLGSLRADRVERLNVEADGMRRYGLEAPVLTISVDLDRENAVRRNVYVGDDAPGGGRYATCGASDAVFVISRETVEALMSPIVGE